MSVRALRRGSIAASRGPAGTPTTYTLFGTADGTVRANPDGSNLAAFADFLAVGQDANSVNSRFEGFIRFDTSAAAGTITAVTLSLYGDTDQSFQDFTIEARAKAWTPAITTGEWVAPASQGALPLLATLATAGFTVAGYNVFTSEAAFLTNINQSGFTGIALFSDRHRTGQTPSTFEDVFISSASESGTSKDPKLVIEALV